MKYCGQNISALDKEALFAAIQSMAEMDNNRLDRLAQAGKRHQPMFDKHPPREGTGFTELLMALNTEFKSRGI